MERATLSLNLRNDDLIKVVRYEGVGGSSPYAVVDVAIGAVTIRDILVHDGRPDQGQPDVVIPPGLSLDPALERAIIGMCIFQHLVEDPEVVTWGNVCQINDADPHGQE